MTDHEITALAREFSAEHDDSTIAYHQAKDVIRFLLRRYCLVEKSKVKEEYHEAKFTCGNVDPCSSTFVASLSQKSMLERLFPEIAKEVES